jgi:Zn-dependent peptidase ImmA (M78 family)
VINERHRERFDANPGLLRFTYAHEVGHWLFHCEDARAGNLAIFENGRIWCRDGSADPTEIQANRFASFLLVPTDRLRPLLPSVPWSGWPHVYKLAEHFAVSPTAMIVRLEQGGWGARDEAGVPSSLVHRDRDDSQLQLPI